MLVSDEIVTILKYQSMAVEIVVLSLMCFN